MQIKTKIDINSHLSERLLLKKSTNNKCWKVCRQKGTLLCCWWDSILIVSMENSMEFPQKTKNRVTIWSRNPTPGHIATWNYNLKRYMHSCTHSSTVYNSKTWKQYKYLSRDKWIKKKSSLSLSLSLSGCCLVDQSCPTLLWLCGRSPGRFHYQWDFPDNNTGVGCRKAYMYIYEYYSTIKINEVMSFAATWMDLETIILNEVNEKEKVKYYIYHLYVGQKYVTNITMKLTTYIFNQCTCITLIKKNSKN